MGKMADYMLNGDDCEQCGEYIGPGPGHPRNCGCDPSMAQDGNSGMSNREARRLAKAKRKREKRKRYRARRRERDAEAPK